MEFFSDLKCASLLAVFSLIIITTNAGVSYQSVRFLHNRSPSYQPATHHHHQQYHFPVNYFDTVGEEIWPSSIFDVPDDFLDVTLDSGHDVHGSNGHSHHSHDFINELELPPDPYLLTGYRAKQAANYLYSHELFFKNIPHAKLLLKLQSKRVDNGLRPNRLGSINIRSPFYREKRHTQYVY